MRRHTLRLLPRLRHRHECLRRRHILQLVRLSVRCKEKAQRFTRPGRVLVLHRRRIQLVCVVHAAVLGA